MFSWIFNMSKESRTLVATAFVIASLGFGIINKAFGEATIGKYKMQRWDEYVQLGKEIESPKKITNEKEIMAFIMKDIPLSNKKWYINKESDTAKVWHLVDENTTIEEMKLTSLEAVELAVFLPKDVRKKVCSDWMYEQANKLEEVLYGNSSNK